METESVSLGQCCWKGQQSPAVLGKAAGALWAGVMPCGEQCAPTWPCHGTLGISKGVPKSSRADGGKVSAVLTGTPIRYVQPPEPENGSSFSGAFYLVGFGQFPERLLLHAEVKESYLASCRSRHGHLICWKARGVSVYVS